MAVGYRALCDNTIGSCNTAVGTKALELNRTGIENTAIGNRSLVSNTSGAGNTAVGVLSMLYNTIGNCNTSIGNQSLRGNRTGGCNVAVGSFSLFSNTSGILNTAIGHNSGCLITTGNCNVILGSFTGTGYTTSNNNVFISDGAGNLRVHIDSNGALKSNGQIFSPVEAKGNSGTAMTINWNDANIQTVTLTGNVVFTFSNPQSGATYQLILTQDGTGGRTITWPTIKWKGGVAPTLTGTANSIDIVTLTYDGTSYFADISKNHA